MTNQHSQVPLVQRLALPRRGGCFLLEVNGNTPVLLGLFGAVRIPPVPREAALGEDGLNQLDRTEGSEIRLLLLPLQNLV